MSVDQGISQNAALSALTNADEQTGYHTRYSPDNPLAASLGANLKEHHPGQPLAYEVAQDAPEVNADISVDNDVSIPVQRPDILSGFQ